MTDSLSVSIVIPTRHRSDDLGRAVESVIRQSRLPNELIIVDQSIDSTSKNRVVDLHVQSGSGTGLVYIHDSSIAGLVPAKEAGVSRSKGDIIIFLEDDIILREHYIRHLLEGFVQNPEMLGCCGVVTNVPKYSTIYKWVFNFFHRGPFVDCRVDIHGNPQRWNGELIQSTHLSGGLSAYRRLVFEKIPFDVKNDFFMFEDIDYSTRAARYFGKDKFFINTKARLVHNMSPVNRAILAPRYARKLREQVTLYKKNRHVKWALPSFLWLTCGLFLEAICESLKSVDIGPLWGTVQGFVRGIQAPLQPEGRPILASN